MVIQGVQHIFHPPVRLDAWPSEDRRSRIVFITRDLDQADLRGTLTLMTLWLDHFGLVGQDAMTLGVGGGPIPDRG